MSFDGQPYKSIFRRQGERTSSAPPSSNISAFASAPSDVPEFDFSPVPTVSKPAPALPPNSFMKTGMSSNSELVGAYPFANTPTDFLSDFSTFDSDHSLIHTNHTGQPTSKNSFYGSFSPSQSPKFEDLQLDGSEPTYKPYMPPKQEYRAAEPVRKRSITDALKQSNPYIPASVVNRAPTPDQAMRVAAILTNLKLNINDDPMKKLEMCIPSLDEVCKDQFGSRFIQEHAPNVKGELRTLLYAKIKEVMPKLMLDPFGNYVVQKFFEISSPKEASSMMECISGRVLSLAKHVYGCRIIQKSLTVLSIDEKLSIIQELYLHVMELIDDQNGNHVIQKIIETVPVPHLEFIVQHVEPHIVDLATHTYGCRVIQRLLEKMPAQRVQFIVDIIMAQFMFFVRDQYGNYVCQHIIQTCSKVLRERIVGLLKGTFLELSVHKYASNVLEVLLLNASQRQNTLIFTEILMPESEVERIFRMRRDLVAADNVLVYIMKDSFGNYVIQKMLQVAKQLPRIWQIRLVDAIKPSLGQLRRFSFGKHIIAKHEALVAVISGR
ncbi:hypothetical protein PCE1_000393 [Barthelona sp. PCE]